MLWFSRKRPPIVANLKVGQIAYVPPWVFYATGERIWIFGDATFHPQKQGTAQIKVVRVNVGIKADIDREDVPNGDRLKQDCRVFLAN